jgi:hypothetical protein
MIFPESCDFLFLQPAGNAIISGGIFSVGEVAQLVRASDSYPPRRDSSSSPWKFFLITYNMAR